MTGVVYFIQSERGGPIKIGWTSGEVSDRLRAMQTASPDKLVVIATAIGSRLDEKQLHADLREYRLRGEWFRDCAEVREVIGRFAQAEGRQRVRVRMLPCGCIPGFHLCPEGASAWKHVGLALIRDDKAAYGTALKSFARHKPEREEQVAA